MVTKQEEISRRSEGLENEKRLQPEFVGFTEVWVDFDKLPRGFEKSPDWWDDDAFGETYQEYLEHTD